MFHRNDTSKSDRSESRGARKRFPFAHLITHEFELIARIVQRVFAEKQVQRRFGGG